MGQGIERTLRHAILLARHLSRCGPQYIVVAVLLELGVPAHCAGYTYLKHAILLFHDNPAAILSKGIYPAVGQLFSPQVSQLQVEQAIRKAVDEAWKNREPSVWSIYFPSATDAATKKPTNAEFIAQIAYFVELWEGCCKEVAYERT